MSTKRQCFNTTPPKFCSAWMRGTTWTKTPRRLEWTYLPVLQHSRRPAKVLLKALSEQPSLFIEMLSAVFKPSDESGVIDPEPENPDPARDVADQAYRLLELWNRLPGTRADGTIDGKVLEAWIGEARSRAKAVGRGDIADSRIGNMLSASPMGADGNWPAEAVREVIDLFRSKPMIEGFWVGKRNRRGVTSRIRAMAAISSGRGGQIPQMGQAISCRHLHTAKALDTLADSYQDEARRHTRTPNAWTGEPLTPKP